MILYSSRRRQVFLYTPIDHIPAFARAYCRGNIAAWRFIRANIDQIAMMLAVPFGVLIFATVDWILR